MQEITRKRAIAIGLRARAPLVARAGALLVLVAALVFLDLNGITVLDPHERLYIAMIAIAERRMDKQGLAELIRELSVPS